MSMVFESIPLDGLRKTHLEQLMFYIELQEQEGIYYGNFEQFQKRHDDLKMLIGWAVEYVNGDGIKFPKRIKS